MPHNNYISAAYAISLLKESSENRFHQTEGPFRRKIYRLIVPGKETKIFKLNPKAAKLVKDFIQSLSCPRACGPSDFYKGGKCDNNACVKD